jgi:hypothetical protein
MTLTLPVAVLKAAPDVDAIARRLEPNLRAAFRRIVDTYRDALPLQLIVDAFTTGNLFDLLNAVNNVTVPVDVQRELWDVFTRAMTATGAPTTAGFNLTFDATSPLVEIWVTEQAARLVTGVTETTRAAINQIIRRGVTEGIPPLSQARLIRDLIGLTPRDAAAVDRFTRSMIDAGTRLDLVESRAARYARRLLNLRARNIARTETMTAANQGIQAGWRMAQDAGLLARDVRKVWIVTPDDRLCPICAPLDGVTVEAGSRFTSDVQATSFTVTARTGEDRITVAATKPLPSPVSTMVPPAHPSCRCTVGLAID